MTSRELERLIRRAGGRLLGHGRHVYYELDGERFALHVGSHPHSDQATKMRARVRRILKRREGK